MSKYNFTDAESKFIGQFFIWHRPCKLVYWKEYGPTEWYFMFADRQQFGRGSVQLPRTKVPSKTQKIIKMMLKLGLLVPEIEDDKEYKVQRALGCVIGRIYYMPEEIREEFINDAKLKELFKI